jgi:competence protein ComEC
LKTNPLATVCIAFCLGIWAAEFVHIPLPFIYILCVLCLIVSLVNLKNRLLFFLTFSIAVLLAGLLHLKAAQIHPADHILKFISDQPQEVYLMGKVASYPEESWTSYHKRRISFILQAEGLKIGRNWHDVQGLVKVTLYRKEIVDLSDQLLLQGTLARPPTSLNQQGFNYRQYLARQRIFALLEVRQKDVVKLISAQKGFSFRKAIFKFKQDLSEIIFWHLGPGEARLLSAILLGERWRLSEDVRDLFINTGTVHILAISGLHVGLIAFILVSLLRFLRIPRRAAFVFTIALLICYALLSGARASVVRATIMAVVVLLGLIINREIKIYNSLGLAALVILIFNPHYLFDVGFQLSFISVISIVYFTPKIEKAFPLRKGPLLYLTRCFSVSLSAWLGIAGLAAYYFNIITPIAVPANLVIIPLLFLVVSTGITFLIFANLMAPLGAVFAQTSALTLQGLTKSAALICRIPFGSFQIPRPNIIFICAYYALLLLIFRRGVGVNE